MRKLLAFLFLLVITMSASKPACAFVGIFYPINDTQAVRTKKIYDKAEWKFCLVKKTQLERPYVEFILEVFSSLTPDDAECYISYINRKDGGVIIYVKDTVYVEDISMRNLGGFFPNKVDFPPPYVNINTRYGYLRKESEAEDHTPYFEFRESSFYPPFGEPGVGVCVKEVSPATLEEFASLSQKDDYTSDTDMYFIAFDVKDGVDCIAEGEVRESKEYTTIKTNIDGKSIYFYSKHSTTLLLDRNSRETIEGVAKEDPELSSTHFYFSQTKEGSQVRKTYRMDYPFNPIVEKVFVGNGWAGIAYYGTDSLLAEKALPYGLMAYDPKKANYKLTDKVGPAFFRGVTGSKLYPSIKDACQIHKVADPRARFYGPIPTNRIFTVCTFANDFLEPDIVYILEGDLTMELYGPYFVK